MPTAVEFDEGELDRLAAVFEQAAKHPVDLTFSMGESVRIIKKFSKANFILKGSGQYAPLSPKYKLRKSTILPGRPILVLRGDLRDSVVDVTSKSIVKISKDNAIVGTTVPYAGFIQGGTGKMPARPFLALTTPIVDAIANTIEADVFNQLENQLDEI
jgi:phage gpG-like protein